MKFLKIFIFLLFQKKKQDYFLFFLINKKTKVISSAAIKFLKTIMITDTNKIGKNRSKKS